MNYEELVKKFENKKHTLFIVLIIIEIVSLFVLLGFGIFMKLIFEGADVSYGLLKIGKYTAIPAFLILIAAFTIPEIILMKQKKKMREYFHRIQESTGLTNDELFAESVSTSSELPHVKNVFLNDTYLINLASYWGCRLDSITDMRMEHTSGPNTSDSPDYYIAVDHDGKTSRVYLTSTYQKKVYKILYKEWQQTIATMK